MYVRKHRHAPPRTGSALGHFVLFQNMLGSPSHEQHVLLKYRMARGSTASLRTVVGCVDGGCAISRPYRNLRRPPCHLGAQGRECHVRAADREGPSSVVSRASKTDARPAGCKGSASHLHGDDLSELDSSRAGGGCLLWLVAQDALMKQRMSVSCPPAERCRGAEPASPDRPGYVIRVCSRHPGGHFHER